MNFKRALLIEKKDTKLFVVKVNPRLFRYF